MKRNTVGYLFYITEM